MAGRFKTMSRVQKGFSLIELVIVVAVVVILAAIALPSYLSAKVSSNEASAVGALHSLNTAAANYCTSYGVFPPALSNLGPAPAGTAAAANLIDELLASGTKDGYNYVFALGAPNANGFVGSYTINANPVTPGQTGGRYFYTDQSGVIRYAIGNPASVTDTPVN
jgi:prepilin-type N-terminal cleavage/methylation domain-containing protein